jgi:hypothetical protein
MALYPGRQWAELHQLLLMFENKGQHLTQCSATSIHDGIPDLDGELLATTSKKQKWRNSTLRENCRAAFRYRICIEGCHFGSYSHLPFTGEQKLKGSWMESQIQKTTRKKWKICVTNWLRRSTPLPKIRNRMLCCNAIYHVSI